MLLCALYKTKGPLLLLFGVITIIFAFFAFQGITQVQEQASVNFPGASLELQEELDEVFPREYHIIAIEVFSEDGSNVLTQDILSDLYAKEVDVRSGDLKNKLGIAQDPVSNGEIVGFYSLADAVNDTLRQQGISLEIATENQFDRALQLAVSQLRIKETLSADAVIDSNNVSASGFYFVLFGNNEELGGGTFRRNVGSDKVTLAKETFNRDIEAALSLGSSRVRVLTVGGDLNIEAEEEGFSLPVLLRIIGLIAALGLLTGFLLRSFRIAIVAVAGLATLFVWMSGFAVMIAETVKPSVLTDLILPLAFMALGVDFFVYVAKLYEERRTGESSAQIVGALQAVIAGLFIALLTDGLAFGSNYVSDVEAIQSFAVNGAFAAVATFLLMSIAAPLLLAWLDDRYPRIITKQKRLFPHVGIRLGFVYRHSFIIAVPILILFVTSIAYITKIETRLDAKDFVSKESNFVRSLDVWDEQWGDVRGEEVSLFMQAKEDTDELSAQVAEFISALRTNEFIARDGAGEPVLSYGVERHENSDGTIGIQIVSEITRSRELVRVENARDQLNEDLQIFSGENIVTTGVTGPAVLRLDSLDNVVNTMFDSIVTTAVLIFLLLLLIFRSFKYALVTIVPMIFVITWTYGFMGAQGLALNFITATIAAVSIGVGIDYAVHIVKSFLTLKRAKGLTTEQALAQTDSKIGFSALIAAVSSMLGFIVLATAPMPLFATYGILGAAMIFFSYIGAFTIIPIMLRLCKW